MSEIITIRGRMEDGGQDTVALHTRDGSTGYRIKKFQIIDDEPGENEVEITCKIYSVKQTVVNNTVNFGDNTLLGVAVYANQGSQSIVSSEQVIFDRMVFNQDIHITGFSWESDPNINYYIELEKMKLDLNENPVVTLKDIRNTNSQ